MIKAYRIFETYKDPDSPLKTGRQIIESDLADCRTLKKAEALVEEKLKLHPYKTFTIFPIYL
jgi:hypothetical protein